MAHQTLPQTKTSHSASGKKRSASSTRINRLTKNSLKPADSKVRPPAAKTRAAITITLTINRETCLRLQQQQQQQQQQRLWCSNRLPPQHRLLTTVTTTTTTTPPRQPTKTTTTPTQCWAAASWVAVLLLLLLLLSTSRIIPNSSSSSHSKPTTSREVVTTRRGKSKEAPAKSKSASRRRKAAICYLIQITILLVIATTIAIAIVPISKCNTIKMVRTINSNSTQVPSTVSKLDQVTLTSDQAVLIGEAIVISLTSSKHSSILQFLMNRWKSPGI